MWSKQQDTRNTNKNMTSFKNKITNRKRKNSKTRTTATETVVSPETDLASKSKQTEEKQKQTKSGKNRNRNRNKKSTENTDELKSGTPTINQQKSNEKNGDVIKNDLENADVVLRNPTNIKRTNSNNSIKRYSDSIVIDNDNGQIKLREESDVVPPNLTRAVSGFFIIDQAKKARRLSDLFRPHSTMKLSVSTENINLKNNMKSDEASVREEKKSEELVRQNSVNVKGDSSKRGDKNSSNKFSSKNLNKGNNSSASSNSYLKRVRSKIYKTKSEQSVDEVDASSKSRKLKPKKSNEISSSRIPEDEVAVLSPNGLRSSITNFDFRLTRQTSNLERVRPKTTDSDSIPNEKPLLAKAKSSSSINLSLLRARRNQLMEKVASKFGSKDVHDEFDFITFGNVPGFGSVNNLNGIFGSQTSLQKQPSWLHIHKEEKGIVRFL
ncbi:uncharacterized protein LOC130890800 [Diorhabda carinulata]|uniref:uncharacterized protein LOC130890800 n=1 Tax=Diorhabda carinulata TaxID=1163345 RepID=UPI0025A2ECEA|nr:uncharacterized protein LOC130890800 [Diorhabda carinulata]